MATIVVDNLVKTFEEGTIREKRAVDALSFRVEVGQIYGLLGPNGAGKTTTLRILSGLMKPTRGRAILAGHDVETNGRAVKQAIGFLTANTGLYQRLSPREMLRFFAAMHGLDHDRTEQRVELLINWLGMGDFSELRGGALSTGQRQRTNIARALIPDPPILIMDEPTLGLDVLSNRVILDFIVRERNEGKSVLLSTHYLDEAEGMCDCIGLMHRGRLIAEGSLSELQDLSGEARLTDIFLKLIDADKPQLPADRPTVDAAR